MNSRVICLIVTLFLGGFMKPALYAQEKGIDFFSGTWKEALEKASEENKLMFIDVYTSWCGPCKMMAREIFPQEEVAAKFNASFVNYKIDAEKGEGIGIAKEYSVKAYPTYLFVDGNGTLFYRSLGSMDAEKFLQEAENALTEFSDPKPLVVWEKEYPQHKQDADFLFGYMEKRQKLRLSGGSLADQYVEAVPDKEKLLNEETLSVLMQEEKIPADGAFYAFLKLNRDEVLRIMDMPPARFDMMMADYLSADIDRAIANNDSALMEKIIAEREQIDTEDPTVWEVDALKMRYYSRTQNEKALIPVLKSYAKAVIEDETERENIKEKDRQTLAEFEDYLQQGEATLSPEEITFARKMYAIANAMMYGYRIRDISSSAVETVSDKKTLREAVSWLEEGLKWSDNFTMFETMAKLQQKLGKQKQAVRFQEKAIQMYDDAMLTSEATKDRLTQNLEKLKKKEPIWEWEDEEPVVIPINE